MIAVMLDTMRACTLTGMLLNCDQSLLWRRARAVYEASVLLVMLFAFLSLKADKIRLRHRITDILDISMTEKDGLPEHICERCRRKIERLEKAAEVLVNFRNQAKRIFNALFIQRRDLKRRK